MKKNFSKSTIVLALLSVFVSSSVFANSPKVVTKREANTKKVVTVKYDHNHYNNEIKKLENQIKIEELNKKNAENKINELERQKRDAEAKKHNAEKNIQELKRQLEKLRLDQRKYEERRKANENKHEPSQKPSQRRPAVRLD